MRTACPDIYIYIYIRPAASRSARFPSPKEGETRLNGISTVEIEWKHCRWCVRDRRCNYTSPQAAAPTQSPSYRMYSAQLGTYYVSNSVLRPVQQEYENEKKEKKERICWLLCCTVDIHSKNKKKRKGERERDKTVSLLAYIVWHQSKQTKNELVYRGRVHAYGGCETARARRGFEKSSAARQASHTVDARS